MTKFNPPLETRETTELIAIANGTLDEWQQQAIDQAKNELKKRGITNEHQKNVLDKWEKEVRQLKADYQKQLEKNGTKSYSIGKMIYILLVAPFILLSVLPVDISLRQLKRENYQKKFRQRLLLLLGGTVLWILFFVYNEKVDDKKRQEEIDKVDISAWEKNRYGTDSLMNENNIKKTFTK